MAKPRNEATVLYKTHRDITDTFAAAAYEAAMKGEGWTDILDQLGRDLDAKAVALIACHPQGKGDFIYYSIGLAPEFVSAYRSLEAASDLWLKRLDLSNVAERAVRGEDLVPEALLVGSDFYRNWLAPQKLFYALLTPLMRREEMHIVCVAFRGESDGSFDAGAMQDFSQAAGHLGRALKIHDILSRVATERDAAFSALDRIPIGVITVDEGGTVLDSNHVASEILASGDGLILDRSGLKAQSRDATVTLQEMIAAAFLGDSARDETPMDTISLERPSGAPDLAVTIGRLPPSSRFLGANRRVAAIYVTDPAKPFELDSMKLKRLYKLTPAEARLAALLAKGLRLEDAATDLEVSLNTVRTHLKRIFSKTGTDRQAELVRLILSGPARIATTNGD